METKRFVIFTGLWQESAAPERIPKPGPEDFAACADGGYTLCNSAGVRPDVVIGDFDSLSEALIPEIESLGIECIKYPREKDDTDTMLCVKYGLAHGYENYMIIGGIGGDFGHTMANLQVLSFLTDMECTAEIVTDRERVFIVDRKSQASFTGRPGAKFSVFSYAERSSGVYVANAKYELADAVLTQSYPVGVSNEFIGTKPVTVSVRSGRLIVITGR